MDAPNEVQTQSDETAASPSPVTRAELYDLVWSQPMLRIATRFGVSSSYLARVCTELRVPRPPRGYWAQLEFGKAPTKVDLPALEPGDIETWSPGTAIGTSQRSARMVSPTVDLTVLPSAGKQKAERLRTHPMLNGAKGHFLKTRRKDDGLLRPYKRLLVDIVVSEESLDRALVAANMLFWALEKKGYRVTNPPPGDYVHRCQFEVREKPPKNQTTSSVWSPDRATAVYINGVAVPLTLFESTEEVEVLYVKGDYIPLRDMTPEQIKRRSPHSWTTHRNFPTGRFCLQASRSQRRVDWSMQWREKKVGDFESLIPRIVRELEGAVPSLAAKLEEARRIGIEERQRWDAEAARLAETRRLEQLEKRRKASCDSLMTFIEDWGRDKRITDFFASLERDVAQLPAPERTELRSRLEKARQFIGARNALESLRRRKSPDEIDEGNS